MMARFQAADIRRYYDRHTRAFVRHGQGHASIHRAVWGPGTRTKRDAFRYVDDQLAALVRPLLDRGDGVHIVDLGCGVGASLCYLAEQLPVRATGITLSPAQVAMARQRIAAAGLSTRVECLEGDYCRLPPQLRSADLAFAIESFVHGPDPERFFAECARLIRPGGLLVICDDVKRRSASAAAVRMIAEFMTGWHINTLVEHDVLVTLANAAGFRLVSTADLTSMLEIHRFRDRALAAAVSVLRVLPIHMSRFDFVIGGRALQACLANGWVTYELNVFQRQDELISSVVRELF